MLAHTPRTRPYQADLPKTLHRIWDTHEWTTSLPPSHLFYFRELLLMWDHFRVRQTFGTSTHYTPFVGPKIMNRQEGEDYLFRRGRSLRASYASLEEIKHELELFNDWSIRPSIAEERLAAIVKRVWELENKKNFVSLAEKRNKS